MPPTQKCTYVKRTTYARLICVSYGTCTHVVRQASASLAAGMERASISAGVAPKVMSLAYSVGSNTLEAVQVRHFAMWRLRSSLLLILVGSFPFWIGQFLQTQVTYACLTHYVRMSYALANDHHIADGAYTTYIMRKICVQHTYVWFSSPIFVVLVRSTHRRHSCCAPTTSCGCATGRVLGTSSRSTGTSGRRR